jgi:hypothetical protein
MRSHSLFLIGLVLSAFGCGGTLVHPGGDGGAEGSVMPEKDGASREGAAPVPSDAGQPIDSSSAGDSATEGSSDGGPSCNTLTNTASPVTVQEVAENPPAALGGTVEDGMYELTDVTIYTGTSGPSGATGTAQTTIEIGGSIVQVVSSGTPPTRTTTLATTGTTFTSTDTCPDAVVSTGSFTATPTTFAIYLDGGTDDAGARTVVETFTKE